MAVDDLWVSAHPNPLTGKKERLKRYGRGKRYRVRIAGSPSVLFERKADADRYDANARADLSRGQYIDPRDGRITVRAWAGIYRETQLHRPSTAEYVERSMRVHILPILGHMHLAQVQPSHIKAWVKNRSEQLSPSTLRVVYTHLWGMFAAAVADKKIAGTPCVGIRLPAVPDPEHFIPSPDQVHAVAEAVPAYYRAAVYVAAGCGLRRGEVFGLEVADVDFLGRELHVRRQLSEAANVRPYLGELKTKTSSRTVELGAIVANALAQHIEHHLPKPVEIEDKTDPLKPVTRSSQLLFATSTGIPVRRSSWSGVWAPAVTRTGLPAGFGLHGLRHYYATLLIHGGASVKTVQLALGHSTPTITLNAYTHVWPDALDRTRNLVDAALGAPAAAVSGVS
jgi:integrase